MAEAMAIGKARDRDGVTPGNVDFHEQREQLPHRLRRSGESAPNARSIRPRGEWADPSIEARCRADAAGARRSGRGHGKGAESQGGCVTPALSPEATGRRMRRRLERLAGISRQDAGVRGLARMIGVFPARLGRIPGPDTPAVRGGQGSECVRLAGPVAVPTLLVVPVGLAVLVVPRGPASATSPRSRRWPGRRAPWVGVLGLVQSRQTLRRVPRATGTGRRPLGCGAPPQAPGAVIAAPIVLSGKAGLHRLRPHRRHRLPVRPRRPLRAHRPQHPDGGPPPRPIRPCSSSTSGSGYPGGGQWTLGAPVPT